MQRTLSLFLFTLSSGCVTIPNTRPCTVAGLLSAGAICAETLTGKTSEITFDEVIDMITPRPASEGVPARAGAILLTTDDYNRMKTALDQACRELGTRCKREVKDTIEAMDRFAR